MNPSLYHIRPKLDDILDDKAPYPYTLGALIAFLSKSHCLEILEFILEVRRYRHSFRQVEDRNNRRTLHRQWHRILQSYIVSGAPREINISDNIRDDLLATVSKSESASTSTSAEEGHPPDSALLDPALREMRDLLHDSILLPFIRSCSSQEHPRPLSTPCLHHDAESIDQKEYAHSDIFPFIGGSSGAQSQTQSGSQSPRPSYTGDRSHASSLVFTDDRPVIPGISSHPSKRGSVSSGAVQSTSDGVKELDLAKTKSTPSRRSEGDRHHQEQRKRWRRIQFKSGILRHLRRSSR